MTPLGLLANGCCVQQVKAVLRARNRLDMGALRIGPESLHKRMADGTLGAEDKGLVRLVKQRAWGHQVVQRQHPWMLTLNDLMPPSPLFDKPYQALVLGAQGAIGHAFVQAFRADAQCAHVEPVSRSENGFDLLDAASICQQAQRCQGLGLFEVIIDATGALTAVKAPVASMITSKRPKP